MDILAVHEQLTEAGFAFKFSEIETLLSELRQAIADGRVKSTISASGETVYPLNQVFNFLLKLDRPNNPTALWYKAVDLFPNLDSFKTTASYSKTTVYKGGQGVASLSLTGIIILAAIVEHKEQNTTVPLSSRRIYVLKDAKNQALKVGYSSDVEKRMAQHKCSNPFLVPIAFFPVNQRSTEVTLHRQLDAYRIPDTREWYIDSPQLRSAICDFFAKLGIAGADFND